MKKHLTDSQIWKLKFGLHLLEKAESLLNDTMHEVDEKSDYEADTEGFKETINKIGDIAVELDTEYIPKKKLDDYMQSEKVALLARDLPEMIEYDEVKQTFKLIKEVIEGKVTDKKFLEDVLNYTSRIEESKDWDEFVFTKKFIDLYIKGNGEGE